MSPRARAIAVAVLAQYGRAESDLETLLSPTRERPWVEIRSVSAWICRQLYRTSYPELAREFERKDHTTMMAAVERATALVARNLRVRQIASEIIERLAREPPPEPARPEPTIELDPDWVGSRPPSAYPLEA